MPFLIGWKKNTETVTHCSFSANNYLPHSFGSTSCISLCWADAPFPWCLLSIQFCFSAHLCYSGCILGKTATGIFVLPPPCRSVIIGHPLPPPLFPSVVSPYWVSSSSPGVSHQSYINLGYIYFTSCCTVNGTLWSLTKIYWTSLR